MMLQPLKAFFQFEQYDGEVNPILAFFEVWRS